MRWQRQIVRVINRSRGQLLGGRIRLAESGLSRIVGLLGERGLEPGEGLLLLPSQGVHTWGMRFAIDVAVLDGDWKVLALRSRMRAFRVTPIFWKAAAVLELPAGTLESTSTAVGDELELEKVKEGQ